MNTPATFSVDDRRHMVRALELAARGLTTTHPNPRVGCVIASGATVIAEGWHVRSGGPLAEADAEWVRLVLERQGGATL